MPTNPVSYKITEKTTEKDVYRIFDSIRKRFRAAYTYWREDVVRRAKKSLGANWKPWCSEEDIRRVDKEVEKIQRFFVRTVEECAGLIKEGKRDDITARISYTLSVLRQCEGNAYSKPRGEKHIASLKLKRPKETRTEWLRSVLLRLKKAYPYVTSKNMHRLTKAISRLVVGMDPDDLIRRKATIYPADLLEFGISAAEIAGPWYPKGGTIQSPMDWIREEGTKYQSLEQERVWQRSPDAASFVGFHILDPSDSELVRRVERFYNQHHRVPSVQQLRDINRALERERMEESIEENVETVQSWLQASRHWRNDGKVVVPPLMGAWRIVESRDAEDLCRRAQKDGLCVVDAVCNIYDSSNELDTIGIDEEGEETVIDDPLFIAAAKESVCTLLFSTDPKCRTIVGLDERGICTSEHHCTGRDNKLDKAAWEYFKKH